MALPCYGDEDRDIDSVIDDELGKTGIGIAMEARGALRRNLGGDRLATRGEIAKLALYAHGKREIELEDVLAMTGDVSGISVDDAVDAMLDGKVDDFDQAFTRQSLGGSQAYLVLAAAYPADAVAAAAAREAWLGAMPRLLWPPRGRRSSSRGASWWSACWRDGRPSRCSARWRGFRPRCSPRARGRNWRWKSPGRRCSALPSKASAWPPGAGELAG